MTISLADLIGFIIYLAAFTAIGYYRRKWKQADERIIHLETKLMVANIKGLGQALAGLFGMERVQVSELDILKNELEEALEEELEKKGGSDE